MARAPRGEATYAVFPKVVDAALGRDGSLFTPDHGVWTLSNLEDLDSRYTGQPDLRSDVAFESKLRTQLSGAPDDVTQLMAEVHYLYYLPARYNINGSTKRTRIREILSWMKTPVEIPAALDAVLDEGVGSGGPAFSNKKWPILIQLIHYAIACKRLSAAQREAALTDPWAFKAFINSVPLEPGSQFARESLLHVAFPDTFERTFSQSDKWAQANTFGSAFDIDDDDVDRRLWNIRQRLSKEYGANFDLYETIPVRALWKRFDDPWTGFIYWASRCHAEPNFDQDERDYKLRIAERVEAARVALREGNESWSDLIKRAFNGQNLTNFHAHGPILDWVSGNREAAREALSTFFEGSGDAVDRLGTLLTKIPRDTRSGKGNRLSVGTVLLLGIDPYSYPPYRSTRFERALRLTDYPPSPPNGDEAAIYRHALGFLDHMLERGLSQGLKFRDRLDAQGALWAVVDWEAPKAWSALDQSAFERFRQTAAKGDPEDEDAEDIVIQPAADEPEAERKDVLADLAERLKLDVRYLREIASLLEAKRQVVFYGPPGTGKTYVARELARALAGDPARVDLVQFHPSYAYEDFVEGYRPALISGQPGFELREGPFKRRAGAALDDPAHTHFLIVDEINRGNVAKVLGELYFLLEYRDEAIMLQYSNQPFRLPRNLRLIATMNTADRSIALLDAALRRRFAFVPFFPDTPPIKGLLRRWLLANRPAMVWVADLVERTNERLADRNGAIGPSFFLRSDLDDERLDLIWRHEITPYLEDHFFDEPERLVEFSLERLRSEIQSAPSPGVVSEAGSTPPLQAAEVSGLASDATA